MNTTKIAAASTLSPSSAPRTSQSKAARQTCVDELDTSCEVPTMTPPESVALVLPAPHAKSVAVRAKYDLANIFQKNLDDGIALDTLTDGSYATRLTCILDALGEYCASTFESTQWWGTDNDRAVMAEIWDILEGWFESDEAQSVAEQTLSEPHLTLTKLKPVYAEVMQKVGLLSGATALPVVDVLNGFTATAVAPLPTTVAPGESQGILRTLGSLKTPYPYYVALAMLRHPDPDVHAVAVRFLQANDALFERVLRSKKGKSQEEVVSDWFDTTVAASNRPSAGDYAAFDKTIAGCRSMDPGFMSKKVATVNIAASQSKDLKGDCAAIAHFFVSRDLMLLEPQEGSMVHAYVALLDKKNAAYGPTRVNSPAVDPRGRCLPEQLVEKCQALLRERSHSQAGTIEGELEAIMQAARKLDRESKADGVVWMQVAYLTSHDADICALSTRIEASRFAIRAEVAAALLDELLADEKVVTTPRKKKKKKKKAETLANEPISQAESAIPNPIDDTASAGATPLPSPPALKAAVVPTQQSSAVGASVVMQLARMTAGPLGVQGRVDLGGVALWSRLSAKQLKSVLAQYVDPCTFAEPNEPIWKGAARSLEYHMRKHTKDATVEDYLQEAFALYDRSYNNELTRRAGRSNEYVRVVRTTHHFAAFGWDKKFITMCNKALCGTEHYPQ